MIEHQTTTAAGVAQLPVQPPSTNFIPSHYQVHLHSSFCINCGSGEEWTCVYAYDPNAARMAKASHLRVVDRFSYDVPVRTIRAPLLQVPACTTCKDHIDLSHLEKPLSAQAPAIVAVYQAPDAKGHAPTGSGLTAKPAKRKFTLDDF